MKRSKWAIVVLMIGGQLAGCAEMNQTTKGSPSPVIDRIVSRGELRVGISGDMPPMNMVAKDDQIIGIAVPKGDPHLLNWLGNFLHSLEKAGYMNDLRQKWFVQPNWLPQMK